MSEQGRWFMTTQWSVVVMAGGETSPDARAALEELCRLYWYPLYAYVRRLGYGVDEAQDLTQSFFARLLEKNYLQTADRERGRFRSFLLTSFKHFVANEWVRERARKRGGGQTLLSLNIEQAEEQFRNEPADSRTPLEIYEKRWVLALLERVFSQLRREYDTPDRARVFEALKAFLTGDAPGERYRTLAEELEMSESALKVAVHRLRRRFKEALVAEISQTVATREAVDDEIRYMLEVMSRR